jgi:putative redox protein
MPHATLRWLHDQTFVGTDSSKHSVVISTQDERNGAGMKPAELLLVALASCSAVDLVAILEKKRARLESLEIHASGAQDAEPPWTYRRIQLDYRLRGSGLTRRGVEQAIRLAEEKYCCVAATLRGVAEITYRFDIEDSAAEPADPGAAAPEPLDSQEMIA